MLLSEYIYSLNHFYKVSTLNADLIHLRKTKLKLYDSRMMVYPIERYKVDNMCRRNYLSHGTTGPKDYRYPLSFLHSC